MTVPSTTRPQKVQRSYLRPPQVDHTRSNPPIHPMFRYSVSLSSMVDPQIFHLSLSLLKIADIVDASQVFSFHLLHSKGIIYLYLISMPSWCFTCLNPALLNCPSAWMALLWGGFRGFSLACEFLSLGVFIPWFWVFQRKVSVMAWVAFLFHC